MADSTKLNPQIENFLAKLNGIQVDPFDKSLQPDVQQGRHDYLMFSLINAGWPLSLPRVEDIDIPSSDPEHSIPARIYTPVLGKTLPALVYFHGGGWQRGDLATHDSICRHFAKHAGCIVMAVQWRLAPEHRFPIGINDCFAAYKWLCEHGKSYSVDTHRLAVGGDSAGGNMTAVTVQRLQQTPWPKPVFQLLLYPALDLSCSSWSYKEFAEGYFLTTEKVKCYVNDYLNKNDDISNPMISPLKAKDLHGLPQTHIVTAGYDPLRGEAEAYVQRLREAGVTVSYKCYEDMIHAFLHMNYTVPAVEEALQEISVVLKQALNQKLVSFS